MEFMPPVDSAFVKGTLHLQHAADSIPVSVESGQNWTDSVLMMTLFIVFICLNLLMMRKTVNIIPSIIGCLFRSKENVNLDNSMRLKRDRDAITLLSFIPLCMLVSIYGLYAPSFITGAGIERRFLITTGAISIYFMLKNFLSRTARRKVSRKNSFDAASHAFFTFEILMTGVLLTSAGIMSLMAVDLESAKKVLMIEIVLIFTMFILIKAQLLSSFCNIFSTILYLCTLDLLPSGILVASAILL